MMALVVIKGSKRIDSLIIYVILTKFFLGLPEVFLRLHRFRLFQLNLISVPNAILLANHLDTIIIVIVIIKLNLLQFH